MDLAAYIQWNTAASIKCPTDSLDPYFLELLISKPLIQSMVFQTEKGASDKQST